MATGNTLISSVAKELDRDDLAANDGTIYTADGVDVSVSQRALNDTIRDIFNKYPFTWRVKDPPISKTSTSGVSVYTFLGTDQFQDISIVVWDTGSATTRVLTQRNLGTLLSMYPSLDYASTQIPVDYAKIDRYKIKVAPRPNSSSHTIRAYLAEEFVDITTFTAEITAYPDKMIETIKLGMLYRLYRHLHEWDAVTAFFNLYENAVKALIKEDKDNPGISFIMQEARFGASPLRVEYWKIPTIERG